MLDSREGRSHSLEMNHAFEPIHGRPAALLALPLALLCAATPIGGAQTE